MSQTSISSFFITRKRGIEDDVVANKKKVICLERTHNSSESHASQIDSEELEPKAVFPKVLESYISSDDEPKKMVKMSSVRQGITPQRTTRSRKVHLQEVDGVVAPKLVNFWKGGNLSPQKKSKSVSVELSTPPQVAKSETSCVNDAQPVPGMSTPTKNTISSGSIEKTTMISNNGMKPDEIKKKLKGSTRLAELKTSLNKLNNGFDKLEQMEKRRLESAPIKVSSDGAKSLKPFKSIELEILR